MHECQCGRSVIAFAVGMLLMHVILWVKDRIDAALTPDVRKLFAENLAKAERGELRKR